MTTITEVEALRAVPIGNTVRITSASTGRQEWVRVENGFTRDGTESVLSPDWFGGAVAAGQVEEGPLVEVGTKFVSGTTTFIVCAIDTGEPYTEDNPRLRTARFSGDQFYDWYSPRADSLWSYPKGEMTERERAYLEASRQVMRAQDDLEEMRTQRNELMRQLTEARTPVRDAWDPVAIGSELRDLAAGFDDGDDTAALHEWLASHGQGVTYRENVRITIEGHTDVSVSADAAEVGSGVRVTSTVDGTSTVHWTYVVEGDDVESDSVEDVCEDTSVINEAWIREMLDSEDISYDDFEITRRSCTHCNN